MEDVEHGASGGGVQRVRRVSSPSSDTATVIPTRLLGLPSRRWADVIVMVISASGLASSGRRSSWFYCRLLPVSRSSIRHRHEVGQMTGLAPGAVKLQTAFLSTTVAMSAYYLKNVVPHGLSTIYEDADFMVIQCICWSAVLSARCRQVGCARTEVKGWRQRATRDEPPAVVVSGQHDVCYADGGRTMKTPPSTHSAWANSPTSLGAPAQDEACTGWRDLHGSAPSRPKSTNTQGRA